MAVSNSTDRFNGALAALAIKVPCVVFTDVALTLSGEQTVNGVAVVSLDRVLVKDQADPIENGIYVASSSSWDRAPDWDGNRDVTERTIIVCGRSGGGSNVMYQQDSAGIIRVGTDPTTFSLFFDPDAPATAGLQAVTDVGNATDTGILLQGDGAAAGTLTQRDATDTDSVQLFLDGTDYNIQVVTGVVDFDIGLNATGLMNFHRPLTTAFGLADRVYGNFGDLTPSTAGIGASADADHIVAVNSSTAGDQVGFHAQASVGSNFYRAFFGVHDGDLWGLAGWGVTNPPEFIIESGGESIIEATFNAETRFYYNNVEKLATVLETAADQISGAEVLNADGVAKPVGLGVVEDDGTTFGSGTQNPFQQVNAHESIKHTNGSAAAYTTYADTGTDQTNIPAGAQWEVKNDGAGALTILGGTSVTLYWWDGGGITPPTGTRTLARGSICTVRKISDTRYEIWGNGLT